MPRPRRSSTRPPARLTGAGRAAPQGGGNGGGPSSDPSGQPGLDPGANAALRLSRALTLRGEGLSYREIGKDLHISKQRVHQLLPPDINATVAEAPGPLNPCRTCGHPIPWPVRKGYKGRFYRESASNYRQRVYCAPACNPGSPRGNRIERERQAVQAAEARAARRPLPDSVRGPWDGEPCAVCGFPVRRSHPLHRNPNPRRSDPPLVRL